MMNQPIITDCGRTQPAKHWYNDADRWDQIHKCTNDFIKQCQKLSAKCYPL